MFNTGSPSLADIAAVTKNNDGYGDGFGGGWWAIIILLALCGGFNGFGGFGGGWGMNGWANGNFGFLNGDMWRGFDTQSIMNKLNGLENGVCDLGYQQLAQTNGINTNIFQTGASIREAINADTVANMQNTFTIGSKIDSCCCDNKAAIADLKYTIASQDCAIKTAIEQAAQAIMQNSNANYRQLHDEHIQEMMENYKAQIAAQQQALQFANLKASQAEQNTYLIDQLNPCARPAYIVCNPRTGEYYNPNQNCGRSCPC